jgi:carboxyl-terminal processing protease
MLTRNLQIICVAMIVCVGCFYQARRLRLSGEIGTAMQLISRAYVEPVDQRQLFDSAMSGMLADLDPYSSYIPPVEYQPFQDVLKQQFEGLGVNLEGPPAVERLTVVAPLAGSPAYQAGVEPGDVILEIDGKTTESMSVADASKLLRGPEGTSVHLKMRRKSLEEGKADSILDFEIRRAALEVESVVGVQRKKDGKWDYYLPGQDKIAYVRIDIFGERTTDEFRKALEEVKGDAQGLVLDLRDNAGGLLPAAVDICDLFLDRGPIVTIQGRLPDDRVVYDATEGVTISNEVPIVVLINGGSASASEIVAAALHDQGRAKVAGERSFGKGTIQQVFVMDGGRSGLKLTTAKYYPPSGTNIHRSPRMTEKDVWGIMPDEKLRVSLTEEQTRKLYQRWRNSEVPGAGKISSGDASTANPDADGLSDDPALQKAHEHLKEMLHPI